jgi:hypothetical protein
LTAKKGYVTIVNKTQWEPYLQTKLAEIPQIWYKESIYQLHKQNPMQGNRKKREKRVYVRPGRGKNIRADVKK